MNTMLASAEGASGEHLESFMRLLRKSRLCIVVLGKKLYQTRSTLRIIQSHSFTNTCVLRARPQQRETMLASVEGAGAENAELLCEFYAKAPFPSLCLAQSAQNTQCSENAPNSLTYEHVGLRASRTKRKRCLRAPKARTEKLWTSFAQKCFLYHCASPKYSKHRVF